MDTKQKFGCLITVIRILIVVPMGYALQFLILKQIGATDVMWLLYWTTLPLGLALTILFEVGNQIINPTEKK